MLSPSSDLTRELIVAQLRPLRACAPLFDLAPRRVWLFSLQRLVRTSRSRYPSHCPGHSLCSTVPHLKLGLTQEFGGGALPPALPFGVRTFLRNLAASAIICKTDHFITPIDKSRNAAAAKLLTEARFSCRLLSFAADLPLKSS